MMHLLNHEMMLLLLCLKCFVLFCFFRESVKAILQDLHISAPSIFILPNKFSIVYKNW